MKILNLQQFNEKLDIKPVTKDRINMGFVKPCHTVLEMKNDFKTGDIVVIGGYGIYRGKEESYCFKKNGIYISYQDIEDKTYNDMLGKGYFALLSGIMKKGVFVSYMVDDDIRSSSKMNFTESWVSKFDNDFVLYDEYINFKVMCVCRIPKLKLPLTLDYFKNPPIDKSVLVWKRK